MMLHRSHNDARLASFVLLMLGTVLAVSPAAMAEEAIDFNQQIRPIFTQYCSSCHGGVKQAGDVSFVYPDQVLPPDGWVIEPGDPDASVLIERVTSDDPDLRMPPPDEHPEPLPAEAIELLTRWIAEGAKWGDHWSLAPLVDPIPHLNGETDRWSHQPLDVVVSTGLSQAGLRPSPQASPEQWLRRVSFDLTGLPPTYEQTQAFTARCAEATASSQLERLYAKQVDELLCSPAFGERWASVWMDLARYADSKGFEKDPHRDMWPYRDWLIRAFNDDMPYDQFTIKQIAGDLLADPSPDDLIATAFHRNTQTNTEGGTDDEEFRVAAVIDRINTTWTVWQATTMGCVQCHSHPYDPFRQEEYYSFMALFNNTLDADLDSDFPTLSVPLDHDQAQAGIEQQRRYEANRIARNDLGRDLAQQVSWQALTPLSAKSTGGRLKIDATHVLRDGGTFPVGVQYTIQTEASSISAVRIDILPESNDPAKWPEQGSVLSQLELHFVDSEGNAKPIELADVFVDGLTGSDDPRSSLSRAGSTAIGGYPKLHGPRWAVFVLKDRFEPPPSGELRFTMVQSASVTGNLATPLRNFRLTASADSRWSQLLESDRLHEATERLAESKREADAARGAVLPIVLPRPNQVARSTRLFIRGNWTDRGDEVSPGVPAVFAASSTSGAPIGIADRLDLARWLVSPENPLAARVWSNRVWSQLFGIGIVETLEDFGSSGLLPANPALLDHLAISMRDKHAWRLKPFLREIVLSSTYRQTNHVDESLQQRDPANRLLARGPRTRLTAEMVRDQALAASGLLVEDQGGVSVMPPQPEGVWQTVYSGAEWKTAEGQDRYRRALYTYWRRTSPYPSFLMFDSPTRDLCTARRIATNTPLQALVTLNDPVYVESSASLARRAATVHPNNRSQQVAWMFQAVTQCQASDKEQAALVSLLEDLLTDELSASSQEAGAETIGHSDGQSDGQRASSALTLVANTILNLDRALTK